MPKINNYQEIDITPEKFLEACSPDELQEVDLLIQSNRFKTRMAGYQGPQFNNEDYLGLLGAPDRRKGVDHVG